MIRNGKFLKRIQSTAGFAQKKPPGGIISLILLLTFTEFYIDTVTPLRIVDWLFYFAPLVLSVQLRSRRFPYVLASMITVLVFIGWYLSPAGEEPLMALVLRSIGLCVFWMGALLVSARAHIEQKLEESARLNAAVLADQLDAVSRFKADGTLIFANDYYCCYFGMKREDLIGQKWHPVVLEEDLPIVEERMRLLSPANPMVIIENRLRNGTGELRWMQFVNRANFDAAGQITEIQSVGRDVTARRQAEESLRESEQRFRQLAENIQEIFWLYDVNHNRITYISPHYEKLWGRPCAALYADPYDWVKAIHPDDRERVLAAVENQAQGSYQQEYRIVLPDGEVRWTRGRAFPVRDDSGHTLQIVGVHEDTTLLKRNWPHGCCHACRVRFQWKPSCAKVWRTVGAGCSLNETQIHLPTTSAISHKRRSCCCNIARTFSVGNVRFCFRASVSIGRRVSTRSGCGVLVGCAAACCDCSDS